MYVLRKGYELNLWVIYTELMQLRTLWIMRYLWRMDYVCVMRYVGLL